MTDPSPTPRMRISGVVLGAPDPRGLAAFYSHLLGWPVTDSAGPRPGGAPEDGWAQLRPPAGVGGVSLSFEYEADYVAPVWPSRAGEAQIMEHVDIAVEDLDAAVTWAVEVGASVADVQPRPASMRVLLDPAGHPFCLFLGRV